MRKDALENFIVDEVVNACCDKTIIDCLIKNAMKIQDNFLKLNSTLQMLIKEQQSTQLALDNVVQPLSKVLSIRPQISE